MQPPPPTTSSPAPCSSSISFRDNYNNFGVDGYYGAFGATYRNPHELDIKRVLRGSLPKWAKEGLGLKKILDLACGSGEITLALEEMLGKQNVQIDGTDPYTAAAFQERVGRPCETVSFEDIENGAYESRQYDSIFCCFALHLADDSHLRTLCVQLALLSKSLIVLTPHKRPIITSAMGWELKEEMLIERIRIRWYLSSYL